MASALAVHAGESLGAGRREQAAARPTLALAPSSGLVARRPRRSSSRSRAETWHQRRSGAAARWRRGAACRWSSRIPSPPSTRGMTVRRDPEPTRCGIHGVAIRGAEAARRARPAWSLTVGIAGQRAAWTSIPIEPSGGQRQRIAIARDARHSGPELVICRRAAKVRARRLDPQPRSSTCLLDLRGHETGLSYMHDQPRSRRGRACLRQGRGDVPRPHRRAGQLSREIFEDPRHPYTRALTRRSPTRSNQRHRDSKGQGEGRDRQRAGIRRRAAILIRAARSTRCIRSTRAASSSGATTVWSMKAARSATTAPATRVRRESPGAAVRSSTCCRPAATNCAGVSGSENPPIFPSSRR